MNVHVSLGDSMLNCGRVIRLYRLDPYYARLCSIQLQFLANIHVISGMSMRLVACNKDVKSYDPRSDRPREFRSNVVVGGTFDSSSHDNCQPEQ